MINGLSCIISLYLYCDNYFVDHLIIDIQKW